LTRAFKAHSLLTPRACNDHTQHSNNHKGTNPISYVYRVLTVQTYLEDTVSLAQDTNKLGVVTVHIPLANPSMTNTDHP